MLVFAVVSTTSGIAATVDARAQTVGMVTKVENQAQVGGAPAAVGSPVHMGDTLNTGARARLQVTFRDQTNLTLGENATIVVDRFVFDPDASVGEAALNATKGAFRLTTGRISDMQHKNIGVQTAFGALAVRGTDFWWGPIEGQNGVLLVHNSRLEVRGEECPRDSNDRRCRCAVTLDQAGEGTDFDRDRRCPGTPYPWPQARIDAALQMTSFQLAFAPSQAIPAGVGLAAAGAGFAISSSNNNEGPPPFTPVVPVSP